LSDPFAAVTANPTLTRYSGQKQVSGSFKVQSSEALYPLLTRLKNADLLSYRWVESTSGPPRKYFSLTDKGAKFYQELQATWNEMANAVGQITQNGHLTAAQTSTSTS
jgi:DNA-binding PadR family transcriptional regulator